MPKSCSFIFILLNVCWMLFVLLSCQTIQVMARSEFFDVKLYNNQLIRVFVNMLYRPFEFLNGVDDICKLAGLKQFNGDMAAPCRFTLIRFIYQLAMQNPDLIDTANIKIVTNNYNAIDKLYNPTANIISSITSQDPSCITLAPLLGEGPNIDHNIKHVMIRSVAKSVSNAYEFRSNVSADVLQVKGMSGAMTRHFYNNICSTRFNKHRRNEYLEVGTWAGSSLVSALYRNGEATHGTVIETWEKFGGPEDLFMENMKYFNISTDNHVNIFKADFFSFELQNQPHKFDIYMYDGPHGYDDHFNAIIHIWDYLQPIAIIIIDDWDGDDVRKGTEDAFRKLDAKVVYKWEHRHTFDGSYTNTPFHIAMIEWWNGIGVFVVEK